MPPFCKIIEDARKRVYGIISPSFDAVALLNVSRFRGFPRDLAEVTGRSTMPPRWGWSSQRGIFNVTLRLPAALARPLGPSLPASGVDDGPGISCISNAGNLPGA